MNDLIENLRKLAQSWETCAKRFDSIAINIPEPQQSRLKHQAIALRNCRRELYETMGESAPDLSPSC